MAGLDEKGQARPPGVAARLSPEEVFPSPPEGLDPAAVDVGALPRHLAVIMDGNGRWAEARGQHRSRGHAAGIDALRELIRAANDIGIGYLTVYSFSTENWSRPEGEVKTLMRLFAQTLAAELGPLDEEGVRIKVIGDLGPLPQSTRKVFLDAVQQTSSNSGMTLVIAVNYGGRQEIVEAAKSLARAALDGRLSSDELEGLGVEGFSGLLETAELPDPDLLIRTSGEYRLSNFLLYQLAYSELYISEVLWPDFDRYELLRAILAYQGRSRRFGGLR